MAGLNKACILGRLGANPESRSLNNGDKVVSFSVATSDSWKDKQSGERREKTEWHKIVIFNKNLAEIAEKYLSKGKQVYLEGEIKTRSWTDQNGVERYTTEIVLSNFKGNLLLLGAKDDSQSGGKDYNSSGGRYSSPSSSSSANESSGSQWSNIPIDDDIPF